VLKANFLERTRKAKGHVLEMNENLFLIPQRKEIKKSKPPKPVLKDKILKLKSQGLSYRKI
jgi:hypothetical protein